MSEKNKNSAFMQPVNLSEDLAAIVGKGPMPRTEVVKKTWDYIKANNCQDPKNKRNILPDEKLAKVFGSSKPVDMFQMTKLISKHITK
ncbi:SWIB/MDM2 domain protein [Chlamydia ibidis]|uniref:SWIB/MDM2 domain protein n=2 Tax=Chlamydia ibidis TaxID=1405396 RepID=S7KGW3_9CHLA|nr:SWIB/MDM2 domain-containing protein [Chlamydia ibidis]EPP35411.1 SWIB/MDM2 domain protein [Chlamydia ibidis]EQM62858.1 SWIB/MDM2 domain protein [Chlamydia ibidis 10-1398/6]